MKVPGLNEVPIGEVWNGRQRMSEYVWLSQANISKYLRIYGEEFLGECVETLDAWIASTAPIPGERMSQKQLDKIRKGWNAAHSFRAWVLDRVREDAKKAPQSEQKPSQGRFNSKDFYGL